MPIMYMIQRMHSPYLPQPDHLSDISAKSQALNVGKETFNILFVVSRPEKDEDIDPHLITEAVVKTLATLPRAQSAKVRLEVCRPGAWYGFKEHLTSRTRE